MKKCSWLLAPAIVFTLAAMPAHAGSNGGNRTTTSSIAFASIDGATTRATSPTPHLGSTVTFSSTVGSIAGWEYPMIATSCYQDVNGDGVVNTDLLGPDVVYTWLDHPDASFLLGAYSSIWTLRGGGPATCRADLDAYGWKGGKESTRVLASMSFEAAG